jgi:hypothetical protein
MVGMGIRLPVPRGLDPLVLVFITRTPKGERL